MGNYSYIRTFLPGPTGKYCSPDDKVCRVESTVRAINFRTYEVCVGSIETNKMQGLFRTFIHSYMEGSRKERAWLLLHSLHGSG